MSLLVFVIHCQFGGRPLMTAVLQEILQYIAKSPDVWFAPTRIGQLGAGRQCRRA